MMPPIRSSIRNGLIPIMMESMAAEHISSALPVFFFVSLDGTCGSHRSPRLGGEPERRHIDELLEERAAWTIDLCTSSETLSAIPKGNRKIHPPTRRPNGHSLGPNQVLVGHQACLGHGGDGHTSWHCRTCDAVVYRPPLNTHCTALEGPAAVRISTSHA